LENYKDLYYFLFNRISDMIQELQLLQQQAEEAYMIGYSQGQQSALHAQQALSDAAEQASHISSSSSESQANTQNMPECPGYGSRPFFLETYYSKTQAVAGPSRQPLLFGRPNKQQLSPPSIKPELVRHPVAE
jgi:hypothetical protein